MNNKSAKLNYSIYDSYECVTDTGTDEFPLTIVSTFGVSGDQVYQASLHVLNADTDEEISLSSLPVYIQELALAEHARNMERHIDFYYWDIVDYHKPEPTYVD